MKEEKEEGRGGKGEQPALDGDSTEMQCDVMRRAKQQKATENQRLGATVSVMQVQRRGVLSVG